MFKVLPLAKFIDWIFPGGYSFEIETEFIEISLAAYFRILND